MRNKALVHFKKVDPVIFAASIKLEEFEFVKSDDYFLSLCREIIGQQLSGHVAKVIFGRFLDLFSRRKASAKSLLELKDEKLRGAGTSWAKVRSLKDLASEVASGKLDLAKLDYLSDEEVVDELIKVKGIGRWTAEMFLMFSLAREDVFSHGDLGLRKAIKKLYRFKQEPTYKQIEKIASRWSPYRTYASLILWNVLDND